jgi:hypothetical protein
MDAWESAEDAHAEPGKFGAVVNRSSAQNQSFGPMTG